jgi:outer membrane receptor protein involved in Fe transport
LRAEGEGGSFDWQRYAAAGSGARGGLDWNGGLQRLLTDNEQPNGRFEQTTAALSSGLRLGAATDARLVFRIDDSTVGTPGATAFGRPDLDASFDRQDVTGSLALRRSSGPLGQRASLSYARSDQLSLNPLDSGSYVPEWDGMTGSFPVSDFPNAAGFQNQTARALASYQADLALGRLHLLSAGVELERQTGALGNRAEPLLHPERTNFGFYLQERVLLGGRGYLTVGGRLEHNGSYGTRVVPRAALAVRLRGGVDATTLRTSAGLGVKEPSFFESYGESFFARGNPDLDPERSTTFDLGLEQRLLDERLLLAATAFHHDYRDQIAYTMLDYTTFEGTYVNLAHTRSQGLELSIEARPAPALQLLGQYTFQDGEILESPSGFDPVYEEGRQLLRRPRHQGSLSIWYSVGRVSLGAALVAMGERSDSDFLGIGLASESEYLNPGYTRLDARARVRLAAPLEVFFAGDNLTGASYHEVLGYPALGRALRLGARLTVGGRN